MFCSTSSSPNCNGLVDFGARPCCLSRSGCLTIVFQGTSVESEVAFTSFRFPETKSAHLEFSPLLALATTTCSHLCRLNNNALGCDLTDKSESSFAVVRFNERTYQSGGVVAVIKGIEVAQRTLNDFDWCQSEESRTSGEFRFWD